MNKDCNSQDHIYYEVRNNLLEMYRKRISIYSSDHRTNQNALEIHQNNIEICPKRPDLVKMEEISSLIQQRLNERLLE